MNRNRYLALAAPVLGFALVVGSVAVATPGHGYVSVPAAGFRPYVNTCSFFTGGFYVETTTGSCYFYAPVQLPQGATVTRVTMYYNDSSSANGYLDLHRSDLTSPSATIMAHTVTVLDVGLDLSNYDETIDYAVIDNSQFAYVLSAYVPDSGITYFGVVIEYTYQTSLPAVLRNLTSAPRGH